MSPEAAICALVWAELHEGADSTPGHPPLPVACPSTLAEVKGTFEAHAPGWECDSTIEWIRDSATPVDLACGHTQGLRLERYYEVETHVVKTPHGWVAYPYWRGGGKHGEPSAIPWACDARFVQHRVETRPVDVFEEF